ncbi:MAG TPA: cyclic nucleotide-binding domain-containing protein [Candidatus Limnocylindrales bacterium]|nr:cyclic nucleotide-binding domain-containing protein [Candidatus Limnocylindrales bacterium]
MPITSQQKSEALSRLPLFAGISEESLRRLSEAAGEQEFGPGEFIVRQGQLGSGLYVILEGEASVLRGSTELARLGPGEFFGEMAVLDQQPRMASVRAESQTRCLAIASWDLLRQLEEDSALALNLIHGLVARIRAFGESHRH